MRCDRVRQRLNALADDALGHPLASRLADHLAGCPACAAEFAEIRRLGEAAAALWCDASAPATLRARLAAALWASSDERCDEDEETSDFGQMGELLAYLQERRQPPQQQPEGNDQ